MSTVDRSELKFEESGDELSTSSPIIINNPIESSEGRDETKTQNAEIDLFDEQKETQEDNMNLFTEGNGYEKQDDGSFLSTQDDQKNNEEENGSGERDEEAETKEKDKDQEVPDDIKEEEKNGTLEKSKDRKEEDLKKKKKFKRRSRVLIIETCVNECM